MRILITGATGMLGKDMVDHFAAKPDHEVYANQMDHEEILHSSHIHKLTFDLTDAELLGKYLDEIRPGIIIHCAAIVNVDICETERDNAMELHAGVLHTFARHSPASKVVYISTDSVFDGEKGDYSESDVAGPLNFYAKSKHQGELNTLALFPDSIVVRTNIYGYHLQKGKTSLAEWAISCLGQQNQIRGLTDIRFNPVYTKQLVETIDLLLQKNWSGLINIASGSFVSKYDFLQILAKEFGFNPEMIHEEVVQNMTYKAARPKNTTLNTHLLASELGGVPCFMEGMKRFHSDYINYQLKPGSK